MNWEDTIIWENIFNEVIADMRPDCVPLEFIVSARYIDHFGVEHMLHGNDLMIFMMNPQHFQVHEAQVVLDVVRLRRAMQDKVGDFLRRLDDHK